MKAAHLRIGAAIEGDSTDIRRLEEATHHYFHGGDLFMLKQIISNIESFLQLYNPLSKYELCRYWQVLEEKGYDPVLEYVKRLEMFDMHYNLRPEDMFIIIIQISRFFKEFADFETKHTPTFRHPKIRTRIMQRIKGEMTTIEKDYIEKKAEKELEKFSIREFLRMDSDNKDEELSHELRWPFDRLKEEDEQQEEMMNKKIEGDDSDFNAFRVNFLKDIGLFKEISRMEMIEKKEDQKPIKAHEGVNIQVKRGRVQLNSHRTCSSSTSQR